MLSETGAPGVDACAHRGLARTSSVFESGGGAMSGRCRLNNRYRPARIYACSPSGSDLLRHTFQSISVQNVIFMSLTPFVVEILCQSSRDRRMASVCAGPGLKWVRRPATASSAASSGAVRRGARDGMKRPGKPKGEKEDLRAGLTVHCGSPPASLLASRAAALGLVRFRYCARLFLLRSFPALRPIYPIVTTRRTARGRNTLKSRIESNMGMSFLPGAGRGVPQDECHDLLQADERQAQRFVQGLARAPAAIKACKGNYTHMHICIFRDGRLESWQLSHVPPPQRSKR